MTHPEVRADPAVPITEWELNDIGRERAAAFARSPVVSQAGALFSSEERKARDAAEIISAHLGLAPNIDPRLGENDRSATGFLAPVEFEAAADRFFRHPLESFRGWERAIDAQERIVRAVQEIVRSHRAGDLVIVSHGAVGTLLFCALGGHPITRRYDQPFQGHYWRAPLHTLQPEHGWRPI